MASSVNFILAILGLLVVGSALVAWFLRARPSRRHRRPIPDLVLVEAGLLTTTVDDYENQNDLLQEEPLIPRRTLRESCSGHPSQHYEEIHAHDNSTIIAGNVCIYNGRHRHKATPRAMSTEALIWL